MAHLPAMFTSASNGLPLNSELHKLPPLPETPTSTLVHRPKPSSYGGLSRTGPAGLGLPSSMRLQDLHELVDKDEEAETQEESTTSRKSSCKWEVAVEYPVLSTRQGGANPPVGRTPSRDYLRGLPISTIKPERTIIPPRYSAGASSDDSSCPSSPIFRPQATEALMPSEVSSPAVRPALSPPNGLSKSPSAAQLTPLLVHACNTSPAVVTNDLPQVTIDTSPQKDSAEEPAPGPQRGQPQHESHRHPQPRLSASFNLPTYLADASLIADCSLMGGSTSGISDDSFDMAVNRLRPEAVSAAAKTEDLGSSGCSSSNGSDTSTEACSTLRPPRTERLDQSTLLPRSPAKSAHLLASTNAINNVQPPWSGDESSAISIASISSSAGTISPEKASSSFPKSQTMRGFPTSESAHSTIATMDPSKTKRTFPSSSSGQSLASVGEEPEYPAEAEMSTLLPVSPVKTAHLLTDAELITRETLAGEASFRLPLPTRATPFKTFTMSHRSPKKATSPLKSVLPLHMNTEMKDDGDVTMDVKDLMAKVGKPKRASGTEESFVDLLHDDFMPDGLDASMMGPDESMMPSNLRPRSLLAGDGSPVKRYTLASPTRPPRGHDSPPTTKRFPVSKISYPQSHHIARETSDSRSSTISRSKSLSRVAEIIERVKSDRATAAQASESDGIEPKALPKTEMRPRTYTTARTPALAPPPASALPTSARPRTSMMPPPAATSRRTSLSTGALPMPTSASHQVELPVPRSIQARSAATASQHTTAATSATKRLSTVSRPTLGASTSSTTSSSSARTVKVLPPARESASARTRPSVAPSATSRTEMKSRTGSTSSILSSSAVTSTLPNARSSTRTAFKPTSTTAGASIDSNRASGSAPTATTRLARPSVSARLAGLPQPGTGPSARSAPVASSATAESRTKLSRGFGTDASGTANRVARPSTTASSTLIKGTSKLSAGPAPTSVARTATSTTATVKSRAQSTPAMTVASSRAVVPPVPTSRLTRPSLAPSGVKKTSMLPPSSTTSSTATTQRARVGGTLPRPPTSRVSATTGGKASAPPTGGYAPARTAAPSSAPAPAAGTNLAALRTRLDALQARQARAAR
ncbi:hypothetical protein IAU59_001333 [Kwoniella sp. CBS 9459]